ncbi:MAG: hypothetical protein NTX50_23580 [Candidatus Sumerlaeota bacterium]|nr:hypothetical protein [Candidatus Sumerlaeota bacterium]
MDDFLSEEFKAIEDLRQPARATLKQMRSDLDKLKRKNQDAVNKVMADNTDQAALELMRKSDLEIEALKAQINDFRRETQKQLQELKAGTEKKREQHIEKLQEDLAAARGEIEQIHTDMVPKAKAALDALLERKKSLEAKNLTVVSRINQVRQKEITSDMMDVE